MTLRDVANGTYAFRRPCRSGTRHRAHLPGRTEHWFKPALSLVWEETVDTTSGRQPAATVEHGRLKEARMNDVPGEKLGPYLT
jgi:hypothetical protein